MPPQLRKKGVAPSRSTPFNKAHLVTFGQEITQSLMSSTGNSSVVTSVRCLFCKRIGREAVDVDDNSRKRLRTTNVKIFERPPFRKENFSNHLKSQHADDFEKYLSLGTKGKKKFFDIKKRT
jgi:2-oxoglutarate dehydrogenase complex dehydrogenase (E1) component-like enzyme